MDDLSGKTQDISQKWNIFLSHTSMVYNSIFTF
jgi:hypothetical protein